MLQNVVIGILAGLVSALLFAMLLKATPLAILAYLLAPLPILIVGLGWSHRTALAAVVAGSVALAIGISPFLGVGFAIYLALPAWWLGYLTLLGRPDADGRLEWYPTGRLLTWIAGTAALAFIAIAVVASPSYETFRAQLTTMSKRVVEAQLQGKTLPAPRKSDPPASGEAPPTFSENSTASETAPSQALPPQSSAGDGGSQQQAPRPSADAEAQQKLRDDVAEALVTIAPAFAAQGLAILLTFYLWLAARIVQISGRLQRPWPDIPSTAMPRSVLALLAGAAILAFSPGYVGALGIALIGALAAAFALQGLAAFHDRSRGRPARHALLFGLYIILFLTQGVALMALTLFGIADTAIGKRGQETSSPNGQGRSD